MIGCQKGGIAGGPSTEVDMADLDAAERGK